MKFKFYLSMIAIALLISNCSKEEALDQQQGSINTLIANIEGVSRSAVTDGGVFSWTAGDAISVYNGTDFTTFTNTNGNMFSSETSITPSGVAIYPAGEHNYNGTTATINLATEYNYGSTNAPMLAEVGNAALTFRHVGGLMRFVVKGMPSGTNSFTFTANSGITGDFDVENGKIVTADNKGKTVTINFTATQYNEESMTFYIPLPTGSYAGYTISIGQDDNMKVVTPTTIVNTINRGTLLLMPTFTYDATNGLTKGTNNVIVLESSEQNLNISGDQALVIEAPATMVDDVQAVLNLN